MSDETHLPNVISVLRIAGSISLLFCDVAGLPFWVVYALCGISDMVDGWLARKLHAETKAGAILDSVSDIVFVACCYSHVRRRARRALYKNEAIF